MAARTATGGKAKIHIIYYSMYGHVATSKYTFKINTKYIEPYIYF
jgi:hypothetical protein